MKKQASPLTGTDFYRYFQCPHWPYWERFGDPKDRRELTPAEDRRQQGGLEHERDVVEHLGLPMKQMKLVSAEKGFEKTLEWMKQGVPLIYQGWLVDGDWVGRPDLLKREEGESAFGNWYYVPIDIKQAHELKKEHKAQLTFYAVLLERIQKRFPSHPGIVNADHLWLDFDASEFMSEFKGLVEALERIRGGEIPEPVYRKACEDTSPWGKACLRLAQERNDIALLFNVDVKKLKALRDLGVRTVDDAADMDPLAHEGQAPGLTLRALQAVQRQARAWRDKVVIVREPFNDPTHGLEIHFDIESHPPTDRDYLYGFWIRKNGKEFYQSFVAEQPEDEESMWRAFLAWLPTLPADYTVYHYAAYEPTRLTILAGRYGDLENPWLQKFKQRLIDLKELTRDHAVFPLAFYSLKTICKFLGFSWTGDVQSGGQSVDVFEDWRETGKRSLFDSILQYNEEDVRATAFLLDWLRRYGTSETAYAHPYPWKENG